MLNDKITPITCGHVMHHKCFFKLKQTHSKHDYDIRCNSCGFGTSNYPENMIYIFKPFVVHYNWGTTQYPAYKQFHKVLIVKPYIEFFDGPIIEFV